MSETKVYCLFHGSYSDRYLVGVFATLELAQAGHSDEHEPTWELWESPPSERRWDCITGKPPEVLGWWGCEYDIDERVLVGSSMTLALSVKDA